MKFFFSKKSPVQLDDLFADLKDLQRENLLDGEVLIARGDKILLDLKNPDISQPDPQFLIGSLSKQFFSAGLLKALYQKADGNVDEVKKLLQKPISFFLPNTAPLWAGEMPKWADTITVYQLLRHNSGLPNYTELEGYAEEPRYSKPCSRSGIIALIAKEPLLFKPGSAFYYSNTNYVLIADILETVSKMPVSDYLKKELFDPIGMNSTYNLTEGISPKLCTLLQCKNLVPEKQYEGKNQKKTHAPKRYEDISYAIGSGSIVSTVHDLLKWNLALHKEHKVLPKQIYELFITPQREGYACGIGATEHECGLTFYHNGSIGTYSSILIYVPSEELSVIVLSNVNCERDSKFPRERGFGLIEGWIHDTLP